MRRRPYSHPPAPRLPRFASVRCELPPPRAADSGGAPPLAFPPGTCDGWRVRRFIFMAFLLLVPGWLPVRAATNAPSTLATNLCPAFALRDQFDRLHEFKFPLARPAVLAVADKKGAEDIEGWAQPLAERFGDRIDIPGLADVSAAPRALRGLVQARFKKAIAHPVMLDWEGHTARAFHYTKGQANLYLIAPDGRVAHHVAGRADAEKLRDMTARVEALLAAAAPAVAGSPATR